MTKVNDIQARIINGGEKKYKCTMCGQWILVKDRIWHMAGFWCL
jgi:DNA-directed RNA polymerase subunit RPC12/RpoP